MQQSPAASSSKSRLRRRAAEACAFCRRRKIKCNAEKPVCANCTLYEQDCSYVPISTSAKEAGQARHRQVKRRRLQREDSGEHSEANNDGESFIEVGDDNVDDGDERQRRVDGRHHQENSSQPGTSASEQGHARPKSARIDDGSGDKSPLPASTARQSQRRQASDDCQSSDPAPSPPHANSRKTKSPVSTERLASQTLGRHGTRGHSRRPSSVKQPERPPVGEEARVARILVSANGVSSYHGRTSALFEENPALDRPHYVDQRPRMPDDWAERGLVAEALRQRQLEDINFRQGKLDFDGEDPDLGMHLLHLHWNRQHHSFLVTYRPAFMRDMVLAPSASASVDGRSSPVTTGPYFSKLLLNAIYFGASKFSPRLEVRRDQDDVRTAGYKYRQRVQELLGESLDRSDITTIQALLVMTNSLFALGDERSAAWLYSGLAFRMLIDLGMHVDLTSTGRFSDEDLEIRRRVYWSAFVIDKIQSLYQGRPVSLKEADALVPIKFLDSYEELEHWQPFAYSTSSDSSYPGSPAYSTSTFTWLCRLSLIMSDILSSIYTERSNGQSPTELSKMLDKVQIRLDEWMDRLPKHLTFDATKVRRDRGSVFPPPHVFSLHAMFHVLTILLHRPFVADGHLYSTSRSISVDSLKKCAAASTSIVQILRAYHDLFTTRRAPYLISYATYVAATILVRIAAKRGHTSDAHGELATCLAVFDENQATNSAVKKATGIIRNLMKRLSVAVEEDKIRQSLAISGLGDNQEADKGSRSKRTDGRRDRGRSGQQQGQFSNSTESPMGSANDSTPALTPDSHMVRPTGPGSDWMDIDSIIQSFLESSETNTMQPASYQTAESVFRADPARQEHSARQQNWSQRTLATHVPASLSATNPQFSFGQGFPVASEPINPSPVTPSQPVAVSSHMIPASFQARDDYAIVGDGEGSRGLAWESAPGRSLQSFDAELLEDPLFGLNGASMDHFSFANW